MRWIVLTDGISPFELGGMQKHSYNLVRQLVIQGQEVLLAHCITGNKKLPNDAQVKEGLGLSSFKSISIFTFRFPNRGKMPGHYIQESYAYSDLIFQAIKGELDQYDVIFAQGYSGWRFIEERKKGKKIPPVVNHLHGLEMFQKAFGWKSRFQQWMLRGVTKWNISHADATVSLGGRINDLLSKQGIPSCQILTISSGIDESWFVDYPKERGNQVKMLFVGRFERRKGLNELIKAYKSIVGDKKEIHLAIAGPIPDHLKDKQSGIVYLGAINDEAQMMRIMDEHHVLVVPSISEGMPTVILEGMARGMAIVCADVGANSIMVDGQNGWVMEHVTVPCLIQVLEEVYQTSIEKINEKGLNSCKRVRENWGWSQVGSNHIQIIESWVNNFKK